MDRFKTVLPVLFSACGFTMLAGVEVLWWIGFACAAIGLFMSSRLLKKDGKPERSAGIVGVVLALAAAVLYMVSIFSK